MKNIVNSVDNTGMPANSTASIKGIGGKCVQKADTICYRDKAHGIDKY